MRKYYIFGLVSFLFTTCQALPIQPVREPRIVSVSGVATIRKLPDVLYIEIISASDHTDPGTAFDRAARSSDATIVRLRQTYNLSAEDVAIGSVSVSPVYKVIKGERTDTIEKYKAQLLIHLSIRKFLDAPKIIADVLKLGIGAVQSFRYDIDKRQEAVREAQVLAFEDARSKALALAKAAGFRSVALVAIETDNSRTSTYSMNDSIQGYTTRNYESFASAKETLEIGGMVACRFEMLP